MTTPPGAVAGNAQQASDQAGGRGSVFTKKYGPLPGWGWAALAGGGALAFFWWRKRQGQQGGAAGPSTSSTTGFSTGFTSANVATLQSEIQQLQGRPATTSKTTTSTSKTTTSSTTGKTSSPPSSTPPPQAPSGPSAPVPRVVGMTFDQAKITLANAGYLVGGGAIQKNYAPTVKITSQTPGAGSRITYGSAYWQIGAGAPTVDLG